MEGRLIAFFTVPGEPVSKERARVTRNGSYTPKRTLEAEQTIRDCYRTQCGATSIYSLDATAEFGLTVDLYLGTRRRRDIDNMLKLVQDALNKIAYPDDSQIVWIAASKQFVPKAEARTEIRLELLSGLSGHDKATT